MTKSSDVWLAILGAEDAGEATIRTAQDHANRLIEQRRKEAGEEVDKIRKSHTDRLDEAKAQSDESVRQLQQDLQVGQQEKKAKAADEVRSCKPAIVQLLLSAVLTVHLEPDKPSP
jgi:vacuolar-type H+-ATPase subunit H